MFKNVVKPSGDWNPGWGVDWIATDTWDLEAVGGVWSTSFTTAEAAEQLEKKAESYQPARYLESTPVASCWFVWKLNTGMSIVLSIWIITPIKVGWIRPVNRS